MDWNFFWTLTIQILVFTALGAVVLFVIGITAAVIKVLWTAKSTSTKEKIM